MAEESKVRLVRCPKCENLLPELPEYSIYKCGSCSAVLRAKNKEPNISSVSSRTDKEVFLDNDNNVREHRHKHNRTEKAVGYADNYMPPSKNPTNSWAQRHGLDMNRSKSVNSSRDSKVGGCSPKLANFARSLRLKGVRGLQGVERDGFGGFYNRSLGTIDEQDRSSALHYPDEGPSSYRYDSVYGYHKLVKSFECLDVLNEVQNFENDRARLLKKLDELKDQLISRPHDTPQSPRLLVPSDDKVASTGPIGNKCSAHHQSPQYHHVPNLTHLNRNSMNDDDYVQNLYGNFHPVSKHVRRRIPYGDSISPGMHRRPRNQGSHHHPQQRTYGYSSRQYADFDEDLLASYPNPEETLYHLPACSCFYCYTNNWKGPLQVPPAGFSNRRFLKDPCSSTFNHYVNSDRAGQHYLPRAAKFPQFNFQDPPGHIWPSDSDSDIDGFARRCFRKAVVTTWNKRLCHPIASGAPFITCYKCFELLKLPRKFRKMMKNDQRLRCGACSTVIVFEMDKKRLTNSAPGNPKHSPTEAEEKSSELLNKSHSSSHGCFNTAGAIHTSSNVENLGCCQTSSKEEENPDNVIHWRDSSGSSELPCSCDVSSTVSSLPFQEQFNNPASNQTVSGWRSGSRTKLDKQEKVILEKNASQVVSEKNAPMTTEVEVSFSGYLNTSSSQDSLEASKEENQLKLLKGSKSFLVGLIKKSFRDFSRSNDNSKNERSNVLVNGQHISDCLVRKAEKQAGPVHPGNYWYDSQAGFWGVMGQPCSGIIPPFIEEFNYPLPENCAAGNTGVFVNGRELHQKDLDMLACKGLPTTSDKSYILDVTGRVFDEATGKKLHVLGTLAPTVEKQKRGFGMQVPGVVE